MSIALWSVQALLAMMFGLAGVQKIGKRRAVLMRSLPWVEDYRQPVVWFIGLAEIAGAVGVILPAFVGDMPILVPCAATGLAVLMLLAARTHIRRREPGPMVFTLLLGALAVFVAWGRFVAIPL